MKLIITNKNLAVIKSWDKKFYKDIHQQPREDNSVKKDKGKDKDDNDTLYIIWTKVPRCIKFKSCLRNEAVLDFAISYLVVLMMTSLEFLEEAKNNQIKQQPKQNPMILDRTMVDVWYK